MAAPRFGRVQKATALVPLAMLSAAWTASLAGVGGITTATVSSPTADATLPDGTSVPSQAIEEAASVSAPGVLAAAVPSGRAGAANVVSTASTSGIPAAALAAYQRAETVINAADKTCNIDWELIAAIGRVESDHGRYGGNTLDDQGVARPGIRGIALDGSNNTQAIKDTDAGQYDDDGVWDRAVGPMQFIPSTWSVVGVDADGDGTRNPQDVDDAALASAVYLCSGADDLGTDAGRRSAVFRYNHSDAYVDLVLSVMEAYQQGQFSAVPNGTTSAAVFVPDTAAPNAPGRDGARGAGGRGGNGGGQVGQISGGGSGGGSTAGSGGGGQGGSTPSAPPATPPTEESPTPETPSTPASGPTETVKKATEETVKKTRETVEGTVKKVEETVKTPLGGAVDQLESGAECLQDLTTCSQ